MRAYELMIIFHTDMDDASIQKMINRITESVEADGGEMAKVDKWGRRRFAYEINHMFEGFYVVLEIVTEVDDLDGLQRTLRLADEIVRHKLMRLPEPEAQRRGLLGGVVSAE